MNNDTEQLERLRSALASRYRIVREIGRGGMATVYLAEDIRHERSVAVKVLAPEIAAALGPQRFLREIQIAAVLAHPHILPLHDSGEADGMVFYVMPYVEGDTLRDRLAGSPRLPIAEAIRITQEVADALGYAHARGVIHRDIKPENILFMGGHAVIADFGVSMAIGSAGRRITEGGLAVGTPEYMSPEQATGQEDVDGRSDIYSLACVLYEMLTGDPPFTGSNFHALLAKKLTEPVPQLSKLRDTVSPPLDDAVRRALAKSPADRFDSISDFAAAVSNAEASGIPSERERAALKRERGPATRAVLLVTAIVIIVAVGMVWRRQSTATEMKQQETATTAARQQSMIAVLPFENLGRADDDYFTVGMSDEITSRLGAVSGLGVVPSRAGQRYARTSMTMRDLGRALGVGYLLVGSVRWAAPEAESKTVRVTIHLVRASDERQLWSKSYDRVIDDIFEVQSEIAAEVVDRLGVTFRAGERARLTTRPTENHEAYTLYLKGRYFWNKRTEENLQTALEHYQQAVDLDPGYSLAWVGIADAWISRGWYSRLAPSDAFPKAKHAALQALAFDSTLAEAHATLAHIHFEFDHDWAAAEREYRRAIELDPRYATAHHWYGGFLSAMGRHDEALKHAEAARALDPLSLIIQTWIGLRHYFAGNNEMAIAEHRKALELDSTFAPAHWHLGWAYQEAGRFTDAIAEAEKALASDKQSLIYLAALGHAYARAGNDREARAVLTRLAEESKSRHVSSYHLAVIHIALGEFGAGLDWLDKAHAEKSPWIGYLRVDPRVDAVRRHARFEALLRKAQLAE